VVLSTTRALAIVAAGGSATRIALVGYVEARFQLAVIHRTVAGGAKSHFNVSTVNRGLSTADSFDPHAGTNILSIGVDSAMRSTGGLNGVVYPASRLASLAVVNYGFHV